MAERKYFNMKKDIHPDYRQVVFMDTTTGYQFLSGSTKHSNETVEFEGETYPLIRVEISSDSHPFYTGRQKFTTSRRTRGSFQQKIRSQISNILLLSHSNWNVFCILLGMISPSPSFKIKKTASIWKPFNPINLLYQ